MSEHDSYALKYLAELSATLKLDSLIPAGKRIPAAVSQAPHELNLPSRFPIQHKCDMSIQSPRVRATDSTRVQDFRTVAPHVQTPQTHPNQAPRGC